METEVTPNKPRRNYKFPVLIILIGLVLLFFNLNIIPGIYKSIIVSWQMLLIALGVYYFIQKNYIPSLILLTIGTIFIYPKLQKLFPILEYFQIGSFIDFWPLLIVLVGIILLLGQRAFVTERSGKGSFKKKYAKYLGDVIDKNVIFGKTEQIVFSSNFQGGEVNALFGEIVLDLRRSKLADMDVSIYLGAVFASIIVYVPADWDVSVYVDSVFGNLEDKRISANESQMKETTGKLVIRSSFVFSNGEIRN